MLTEMICTEWPLRGHFEIDAAPIPKKAFSYIYTTKSKDIILECQQSFNPTKITVWVHHWCQSGCTWEKIHLKVTLFNF
jgi:hypothetical protein